MWRILRREISHLAGLLAERRCTFCAAPILPGTGAPDDCRRLRICPDCFARLPRRSAGHCLRCGEPAALEKMPGGVCGYCLRKPPPWGNIYFYGLYAGYLRELLLALKFGGALHLADGLGLLLAEHPELAAPHRYSCAIPIPLHKNRLRERGFNQSALLAGPLAKKLGIPLETSRLFRTQPTRHQTGLTRELRRRNVAGSFAASPAVRSESIILVDDVLTTGATLAAAALCLLEAGAKSVDIAVIARTAGRNMLGSASI